MMMGRIVATVDDELEKKFRKLVIDVVGTKMTAMPKALEQALRLWIDDAKKRKKVELEQDDDFEPKTPTLTDQESIKELEASQNLGTQKSKNYKLKDELDEESPADITAVISTEPVPES